MGSNGTFVYSGGSVERKTLELEHQFASTDDSIRLRKRAGFANRDFPKCCYLSKTFSNKVLEGPIQFDMPVSVYCRDALENQFASTEDSIRLRKRAGFANRDFPKGCVLFKTFSNEVLESSNQSDMPVSVYFQDALENQFTSTAEDSIRLRKRAGFANRDLPEGCVLSKTFSNEVLESSIQSDMPVSVFCREPEEELSLLSEESTTKVYKLPDKAVQVAAKSYPPRRRICATKHFPQGCGAMAPQTTENTSVSVTSEIDTVGHVGHTLFENAEETTSVQHQKIIASNKKNNVITLHPDCSETSKGKQDKNNADEEVPEETLSGRNQTTNQSKETKWIIVLALMAEQNCPWRQKKRAFNSKKRSR